MKVFNIIKTSILLFCLTIINNTVISAENFDQQSHWSITPRIWVSDVDTAYHTLTSGESTTYSAQKQTLSGLTLRYAPGSMKGSDFLFTYMVTGNESYDSTYTDGGSFAYYSHEVKRTDIELMYRYQFPNSFFNLQAGIRKVELDETQRGRAPTSASDITYFNADITLYEFGIGTHAALFSDSDKHFWFTNVVLGTGTIKDTYSGSSTGSESQSTRSTDINAGYLYSINDAMSTTIRYRAFTTTDKNGLATMRGPELTLSYAF